MNWGIKVLQTLALPLGYGTVTPYTWRFCKKKWSGKRDSNSRHLPWQGNALPLSHSRIFQYLVIKFGGNNRARTCDPLLVRQMLSQLSYAPTPIDLQQARSHLMLVYNNK